MKIKNKLSLEKESILTLNEVNMEEFKGGNTTWLLRSSKRCYEGATVLSAALGLVEACIHDQSDSLDCRQYGSASDYVEYGGCVVSDIEVTCS